MESIGGYFSLDLSDKKSSLLADGVWLNTGRNALEYILLALGDVRRLFIPYYTCEAILEPLHRLGIPFSYYHIDWQLEIEKQGELAEGEYLLYTNYFGIKDEYISSLTAYYGKRLIVDNAQALFSTPTKCAGTLYSFRKFVGVPDGGVAISDNGHVLEFVVDLSYSRCTHLLKRVEMGAGAGYEDFQKIESELSAQPIKRMSLLTQQLIGNIDFELIKKRRLANFNYLHTLLGATNQFYNNLTVDETKDSCPMVYPYYVEDDDLRSHLITNRIFVATYWPNVFQWCDSEDKEYRLAKYCLPLPIDQRYGEKEMKKIVNTINNYRR